MHLAPRLLSVLGLTVVVSCVLPNANDDDWVDGHAGRADEYAYEFDHFDEADDVGAASNAMNARIRSDTNSSSALPPFMGAYVERSQFFARVVASTPAFESCVHNTMTAQYMNCADHHDVGAPLATQVSNAWSRFRQWDNPLMFTRNFPLQCRWSSQSCTSNSQCCSNECSGGACVGNGGVAWAANQHVNPDGEHGVILSDPWTGIPSRPFRLVVVQRHPTVALASVYSDP